MRRSWIIVVLLLSLALVGGMATRRPLFFNLSYLFAALILVSYVWSRANISGLQIMRQTSSQRSQVGQVLEERFLVRNRGLLPKLWVEVRDHSELPDHHASWVVNALSGKRTRGWSVRTVCHNRGRFRLGPVTLVSSDPFGLFEHRKHLPATSTVVVYPYSVDLPHFVLPTGELPGGGAMRRRTHYVTTNVSSVRDYFPGDSFNRIHWPSTARTDRLIVKEFELDPTADVWLFLDLETSVQASLMLERDTEEVAALRRGRPVLPPATEEYGVALAASLARHFLARNRAVGLITYGQRREVILPDRGDRQLTKIMETLAVVRAVGTVPLAQIISAEGKSLGRNTSAIVISPSDDVRWAEKLRDLGRRGIRGIAMVHDMPTFGREVDMRPVLAALQLFGIRAYRIRYGDSLVPTLGKPVLAAA